MFQSYTELGNLANTIDMVALTRDPNSPVVKFLLYLISMETYLPMAISEAGINRDSSKVETLGLIAFLYKELLWNVQVLRDDKPKGPVLLYHAA